MFDSVFCFRFRFRDPVSVSGFQFLVPPRRMSSPFTGLSRLICHVLGGKTRNSCSVIVVVVSSICDSPKFEDRGIQHIEKGKSKETRPRPSIKE